MKNIFLKRLYGVGLALGIATFAYFLGLMFPIVGAPIFGIIIGMLLALLKRPPCFENGIKYTSKYVLQYAIILLGFEMNLLNVLKVGSQSLYVMLFTLSAAFITAYFVGKKLKMDGKVTTLIAVGTSICGGSAIAATAPVIKADDKEVAFSISTIFLFNILAVFIFPFTGHLLGLNDIGFGMWAGTAINDTSSVVAAAYSFSDAAGNFATIVKLTRTLMIIPITFFLAIYTSKKTKSEGGNFDLVRIFPWFVLGFIATSIIKTFGFIPDDICKLFAQIGKFFIIMAMSAIGLNTNIKHLIKNGFKPIFLGLCCWFAVAITSLIIQHFLGLW